MFHKMSNYFHLGLHLLHFFSQILRLSNIRAGLTFAFNLKRQRGISATGFPLFALIKLKYISPTSLNLQKSSLLFPWLATGVGMLPNY